MKKTKVAVAMSGGVDSSVSALLLKKQGLDVSGFFIKFWADDRCDVNGENSCCNDESLKKAKEIAKKLKIPFYILDAKGIFKKTVVDSFISGYQNIETPNPCVICNKFIKFGWFLDLVSKTGFQKMATGHYARIKMDKDGIFHLFSGNDEKKDQSYFLHRLGQTQLSRIIFPLGELDKKKVFEIARKNKLSFENRKESQEICFIGGSDYRDFLKRHLSRRFFRLGKIVDKKNNVIGRHSGLINYTIGQRKGIEQTERKGETKKPLYVCGFDKKNNRLIVDFEKGIYCKKIELKNVVWVSPKCKERAFLGKGLAAKIRYRQKASLAKIVAVKNKASNANLIFNKSQRAVTPGQYAVFYSGDEVLGGGIIQ